MIKFFKKKKNRQNIMILAIAIVLLVAVSSIVIAIAVHVGSGDEIIIPRGCGTFATREWDLNYYECLPGTKQAKVDKLWHEEGTENADGFQKLKGRYLIACTSTFGEVGDKVDFYMSNGKVLKCIIYDLKSQKKTSYDPNPANKWGHHEGKVILEFVGSYKIGTNPYKKLGLKTERTVKAINHGNIFD